MKDATVRAVEGKSANDDISNKKGRHVLLRLTQQCIIALNRVHRHFRTKPWVSDHIVIKTRQIISPVETWNEINQGQKTNRRGSTIYSRDEALSQRTFGIMETLMREVKGDYLE